jgi:hypothetical protein
MSAHHPICPVSPSLVSAVTPSIQARINHDRRVMIRRGEILGEQIAGDLGFIQLNP